MKKLFFFAFILQINCLFGCYRDRGCGDSELPQTCLDQKIEAFKTEPGAEKVIKIENPQGNLYWFVDIYGDGLEEILDEKCELVCITDVEGEISNECGASVFVGTKTVIWEK